MARTSPGTPACSPGSRMPNSGTSAGARLCHLKARLTSRFAQTKGTPGWRAFHQYARRASSRCLGCLAGGWSSLSVSSFCTLMSEIGRISVLTVRSQHILETAPCGASIRSHRQASDASVSQMTTPCRESFQTSW